MHAKEEIARQQEKYNKLLETISERCVKERENTKMSCQIEIDGLRQQVGINHKNNYNIQRL